LPHRQADQLRQQDRHRWDGERDRGAQQQVGLCMWQGLPAL